MTVIYSGYANDIQKRNISSISNDSITDKNTHLSTGRNNNQSWWHEPVNSGEISGRGPKSDAPNVDNTSNSNSTSECSSTDSNSSSDGGGSSESSSKRKKNTEKALCTSMRSFAMTNLESRYFN